MLHLKKIILRKMGETDSIDFMKPSTGGKQIYLNLQAIVIIFMCSRNFAIAALKLETGSVVS